MSGKIIEGRVPPGGWHYFINEDRIQSHSKQDLLEAILDYKVSNGLDVGNIHHEYETWFCAKFPTHCKGQTQALPPTDDGSKQVKVIDAISRWASKIGGLAHRKVDQGTAERRAQICAACPENVEWQAGCQTCLTNALRLTAIIRGPNDVSIWKKLLGCRILGICTRTAIWLDIGLVGSSTKLPSNCWRKNGQ